MTNFDDPRPLFHRAADQAQRLIAGTTPDQLNGPTPCAEYDVRSLLGHMVTGFRRIAHVAAGGNALDIPTVTQDVEPSGWAQAVADARAKLDAVWADDAVLDR